MTDLERRTLAEAVQGVLRHDARNKVGAIRNAAFFLRRKTEKTELWAQPRVADFFSLIEAQLGELEAVLGDRGEPPAGPAVEPVANVAACVRAALEAHGPPGTQLELRLEEPLEAAIEGEALTLALRCLVDNAVEAAGPGGCVTLTAARREGAPFVRVTDTGPGFPPARLAKAALPLETTRPGKAGMGLSVAWRLVRCAGGELVLENGEGGGATAELRLRAPA